MELSRLSGTRAATRVSLFVGMARQGEKSAPERAFFELPPLGG